MGCLVRCLKALGATSLIMYAGLVYASVARELTWSIRYDPKTFDPAKVDDQASESLRFVTSGVLLRLNRHTFATEPCLAESWTVSQDGRRVLFHLRPDLRFSNGAPLTSKDVVATLQRVLDPATGAPVAEEFIEPASVRAKALDTLTVEMQLPKPVVSIGKIMDEAIEPDGKDAESRITAGPFTVAEYRRGEYIRLERNPYYWRKDARGQALPYLQSLRIDIVENAQQDELRFLRGQYQMLGAVPADDFDLLASKSSGAVHDLGPSLNTEQMWFNQAPAAPIPEWEKRWFTSTAFRRAISQSISRSDIAKIAFRGHATEANGFISPANTAWHNNALKPIPFDPKAALLALEQEGFKKQGTTLLDSSGHPVKFSLLTNAGNGARQRMASLIQQDLQSLGITVNIITLDFPALIDRLMHTQDYEAALLGLSNVEPDPSSMMNVWLSSSPNHQWNPSQKTPSTPWEAEIDRQIRAQAITMGDAQRKQAVDRVQQIVYDEQPFIYLVYPNAVSAVSPDLKNVEFSVIQPTVLSNIDSITWRQ